MKPFKELSFDLERIQAKGLIVTFKNIVEHNHIKIKLKDDEHPDVVQKLKRHIEATYRDVICIMISTDGKTLYVEYAT